MGETKGRFGQKAGYCDSTSRWYIRVIYIEGWHLPSLRGWLISFPRILSACLHHCVVLRSGHRPPGPTVFKTCHAYMRRPDFGQTGAGSSELSLTTTKSEALGHSVYGGLASAQRSELRDGLTDKTRAIYIEFAGWGWLCWWWKKTTQNLEEKQRIRKLKNRWE